MKRAVPLSQFMPYGAPDLIAAGPEHLSRAVVASCGLAVAAFSLWVFAAWLIPSPSMKPIVIPSEFVIELKDFMLPEPIVQSSSTEPTAIAEADPDFGVIEPVPESTEIVESAGRVTPPPAQGNGSSSWEGPTQQPSGLFLPESYPDPDSFVYRDELPVAVREVKPDYPSFAREAGVEGLVVIRVLIGKDGRVIRAQVSPKFSVPLLDQAALEAAQRWVFKPALANGRPVAVWEAIPFRFRLHE